jgi:Na+/H+-dicarboxylate symporter
LLNWHFRQKRKKAKQAKSVEIPLTPEGVGIAYNYIEEGLKQNRIHKEILSETMLVFEALFHNLMEQEVNQSVTLTVSMQKTIGEINVKIGYDGKPYVPTESDEDDHSPEAGILRAYHERISYHYSFGYNIIRIVVRRSYSGFQLSCFSGIVLATVLGLPLFSILDFDTRFTIQQQFLFPLNRMFTNAMLMVGAPITLFSMIRNMTDLYIVAEWNSSGKMLQIKTLITSAISVVLAFFMSILFAILMHTRENYLQGYGETMTFQDMLESMVPSNIFEPFETFMPFPMIIVALMITYALCSVGEYFDIIKKGVDICYALFSKMLNVVMGLLPVSCFLAFLTPLISNGASSFKMIINAVAIIIASLSAMALFYIIRLKIGGVKIWPFLKKLPPLIWENFKINSVIDAVPFNIRYCVKNYGYNRKRLSENMPILAQANLDGNCFIIMMIAMLLIFLMGIDASWAEIAVIGILILFLSFGAPNQPGSILIGTLIVISYLKANDLVSFAIYMEVFFGALQNVINVIGDIVTVAIEEQKWAKENN